MNAMDVLITKYLDLFYKGPEPDPGTLQGVMYTLTITMIKIGIPILILSAVLGSISKWINKKLK